VCIFFVFRSTLRNESKTPILMPVKRVISSMRQADMETDQNKNVSCMTSVFW